MASLLSAQQHSDAEQAGRYAGIIRHSECGRNFGKEFYMDENQLEKTWQPPCFFQQYEQDISAVMDRLRKEYPRIYPYEEDAVRFWYARVLLCGAGNPVQGYAGEIRESREYCMLNKTEDFFIFFGRWRGRQRSWHV